jgi:hypothetical protein
VAACTSRFVRRFVKAPIAIISVQHNHHSLSTSGNNHQQCNCNICETPRSTGLYYNHQRKSIVNVNYRQQFNLYIFWSSWQPIIWNGTSTLSFLYAQNCAQGIWGKCVHRSLLSQKASAAGRDGQHDEQTRLCSSQDTVIVS